MSSVDAAPDQVIVTYTEQGLEARSSAGPALATPWKRIAGRLLEVLLTWFTLGIGWFVWSLVVWKDGLTPAKQLTGMRVIDMKTGEHASWWRMALRELIGKPIAGIAVLLTLGVLLFMPFWDNKNQALWDKIAGTVVVDD
jgi:uncharacterized RDD family membrane protein YckC